MAMSRLMRSRCQDTAKQTAGKPEGRTDGKKTRGPNKQLENQKAEFYRYCVANVKKNAKLMRVLFRKADVETDAKAMSGWTRSRCQDNAKPMSRQMRSRCQDECEADVNIMRSRCQGECEADVKTNAKPMSGRPRSRRREGIHTRTRRMEVHTYTTRPVRVGWERVPCELGGNASRQS